MVGVILAVLPVLIDSTLGHTWVRIADFALLYAIALGLNIVVGLRACWTWVTSPSSRLVLSLRIVGPAAIRHPFAVLGAAAHGGHSRRLRGNAGTPTLKLRGDYLAIVTLGFGEIIRIFMNNLNAPINITNGPQGVNLIDPVRFGGFSLGQSHQVAGITFSPAHNYYYLFLILTLLVVLVSLRLAQSRIGRAWVAIREDEVAAESMGINTRNIKLLAFAMGASFAGLSGGLFAALQGFKAGELQPH